MRLNNGNKIITMLQIKWIYFKNISGLSNKHFIDLYKTMIQRGIAESISEGFISYGEFFSINLQNPKNSYPRSKLRRITEFFPTGRVLLKHGTHVASYGEFVSLIFWK
jgi:hypothetical protein